MASVVALPCLRLIDATALRVAYAAHQCTAYCAPALLLVFVGHRKLGALDTKENGSTRPVGGVVP